MMVMMVGNGWRGGNSEIGGIGGTLAAARYMQHVEMASRDAILQYYCTVPC